MSATEVRMLMMILLALIPLIAFIIAVVGPSRVIEAVGTYSVVIVLGFMSALEAVFFRKRRKECDEAYRNCMREGDDK